ncbi:26S proteasome non-ATPase regulatory subunit 6-like [Anthonomus grandis grandis]|uniref:26S proteasome non-ATPase regulatory subunit 6-like n=1 Tax=Anthonomus grandis grandis TaxID=2921223 RepID=UPI002165548B|nr:26S proteasome non-ATPase regulatory subunit 6-like [Anthonomus grandis grandis]
MEEPILETESDDAIFYDVICTEVDENAIDDDMIKNPDLEIAQLKFLLTLPEFSADKSKTQKLMDHVKKNQMAPYYELICKQLNWNMDKSLMKDMTESNTKALDSLESEIEYATNNLGAIDTKVALLNKADYLSQIGDKEETIKTLGKAYALTVALGCKLDNVFHCIRIGLFFNDLDLIRSNLSRCEHLIEEGADWHYRNCFKIYKGLYSLAIRDFTTACAVFTNAISTFVCTELISLDLFIKYTIISAMIDLNRMELKKKIITNPDVLQAIHYQPNLKNFIFSLHHCDYKTFFRALADVETELKHDMLLHAHYQYYVREMKVKAYDQLLSTYISLKISYMADQFGVSEEYLEEDVSRFIAAQKLNYKIDKVSGKILNVQANKRQEMFENVTKQGDLLLNRIHKLSRVINI